ncbi:hypothetical protein [Bacteroides sp.]|uniref:hypothetical protein n=1 Tax=Bacteroides sp. TaxID=29523 RepID=UPI00263070BA|nr:hypothetical protein [Bacteroides sp.]MDD3038250.1 hypothetical protein [Bacteroides sp.]
MKGLDELFVVAWMLFGILLTPLFFIGFDFWAGIRKAKQRGEKITSEGWQRTVNKIARYYNMLLALVVVDCMQISGVWYLDNYYDYHIPIFPFITILGAMVVAAIEVRSIFEKAEDKAKKQISDVAVLAAEIAKHRTSPTEIAQAIAEYMSNSNFKGETK